MIEPALKGVARDHWQAQAARSEWLSSPDCVLNILCIVAQNGYDARGFANLTRAFRGDEQLWDCIKDRHGRSGRTLLMASAKLGDLARVRWLLARGANVNAARTNDGKNSLMLACQHGRLEIARELLGSGANVNAALSYNGHTSLMWACSEGHLE